MVSSMGIRINNDSMATRKNASTIYYITRILIMRKRFIFLALASLWLLYIYLINPDAQLSKTYISSDLLDLNSNSGIYHPDHDNDEVQEPNTANESRRPSFKPKPHPKVDHGDKGVPTSKTYDDKKLLAASDDAGQIEAPTKKVDEEVSSPFSKSIDVPTENKANRKKAIVTVDRVGGDQQGEEVGTRFFGPGTSSAGIADATGMKFIKNMMRHAWDGYVEHAWGFDELKPISKTGHNWVSKDGMGATVIDSLDTLKIMGMEDEFQKAKDHVLGLNFDQDISVLHFETNIRVLGGLLSAYDLSGDDALKQKAVDIADRLIKAFQENYNGFPGKVVNLKNGEVEPDYNGLGVLAEIGTLQLEFAYLSDITGDYSYKKVAENVVYELHKMKTVIPGLYPTQINATSLVQSQNEFTLGGAADSFYEYLLKQWLIENRKNGFLFKKMYDDSVKATMENLVGKTKNGTTYIGIYNDGKLNPRMEHLTCFAGGMLALGAVADKSEGWERIFKTGADVTETCYQMYHRQALGLSPEIVDPETFEPENDNTRSYIQRPEAVESIFIMWRLTHDQKYRDWGMEIAKNIEAHCKVPTGGYSGLNNILEYPKNETLSNLSVSELAYNDNQESFFLAETLKYLYLLFTDDDVIPLEKYVFNTEAHPFSVKDYRTNQ